MCVLGLPRKLFLLKTTGHSYQEEKESVNRFHIKYSISNSNGSMTSNIKYRWQNTIGEIEIAFELIVLYNKYNMKAMIKKMNSLKLEVSLRCWWFSFVTEYLLSIGEGKDWVHSRKREVPGKATLKKHHQLRKYLQKNIWYRIISESMNIILEIWW